jgi:hypothetical protein
VQVDRLTATGCYRAAASVESWAREPIGQVTLRDVSLEFTGGGTAEQARAEVKAPGVDARPLPAWGLFVKNVARLDVRNVRLSLEKDDARPAVIARDVGTMVLDDFKYPPDAGGGQPLVLDNVGDVKTTRALSPSPSTPGEGRGEGSSSPDRKQPSP